MRYLKFRNEHKNLQNMHEPSDLSLEAFLRQIFGWLELPL